MPILSYPMQISRMIFSDCTPINFTLSSVDSANTSTCESDHCHSPSSSHMKSSSIPISDRLAKTASEIQLCQDEEKAERLDYEFYSRVVSGISQSQCISKSFQCKKENQLCLLHIMQTRANGTQRKEEVDDEWAIGHSLEAPCDEDMTLSIASETTALSRQEDDEEIFEMEL